MNAELQTEPRSPNTSAMAYKARVSEFLASRRGKMFGVAEVAALASSCFVLALVLFSYLYFLVPARSRVASLAPEGLAPNAADTESVTRSAPPISASQVLRSFCMIDECLPCGSVAGSARAGLVYGRRRTR